MSALFVVLSLAATPAELPPAEVGGWLHALHQEHPEFTARFDTIARAATGTPYAAGPLGEGPSGAHDRDPLMDLTRVDCVTYIEQCAALAASRSYREAWDVLQRIRYRGGDIGFATRNHFMVADWLAANPWCADRTAELGVPVRELTRTISHRDFFERVDAPGLGRDLPDEKVTVQYIATEDAAVAVEKLPAPGLIIFVGNVDWLFALHTGLFLRTTGETGALYHASSNTGEVVRANLAEYLASHAGRYCGFIACEIGPPGWPESGAR